MNIQSSTEKLCSDNNYLRGCPPSVKPPIKTQLPKKRQKKTQKHSDVIDSSSQSNPYTNTIKTYYFSHMIQNSLNMIQNGTIYLGQKIINSAQNIGKTVLNNNNIQKTMRFSKNHSTNIATTIGALVCTNPVTSLLIAGVLATTATKLYRNHKEKKETPHI